MCVKSGRAGTACRVEACTKAAALTQQRSALRRPSSTRGGRLGSHNLGLEAQLAGGDLDFQAAAAAPADGLQHFDCLGLAQAMVDFSVALTDDSTLERLQVDKGSRQLIGVEERGAVLAQLEGSGCAYSVSAGGSLSNTLQALARLGHAGSRVLGGAPLRVGMTGLIGSDPLGGFYTSQVCVWGGVLTCLAASSWVHP